MEQAVSKSSFKAKALDYFREVESTGKELIITDHGRPVLKVVPYAYDPEEALQALRGSVVRYSDPLEPVGTVGADDPGWRVDREVRGPAKAPERGDRGIG